MTYTIPATPTLTTGHTPRKSYVALRAIEKVSGHPKITHTKVVCAYIMNKQILPLGQLKKIPVTKIK